MINLGDSKQSTPTVSKNLNPEWNVTFDLPIDGIQSVLLEAVCWDRDRFGKDFLGEFDVVVEDIFANGQTVQEVCGPREETWTSSLTSDSHIGTCSNRGEKERRGRDMYPEKSSSNLLSWTLQNRRHVHKIFSSSWEH